MDNIKIKGVTLDKAIAEAHGLVEAVVIEASVTCSQKAARHCVQLLKTALIGGTGKYRRGWKIKREDRGAIVYQSSQPSLTHLLENGHDVVRNGVKIGETRPIPHIKPAEELSNKYFEEIVLKELQRRLEQ